MRWMEAMEVVEAMVAVDAMDAMDAVETCHEVRKGRQRFRLSSRQTGTSPRFGLMTWKERSLLRCRTHLERLALPIRSYYRYHVSASAHPHPEPLPGILALRGQPASMFLIL
mmetsp:Transcript_13083/g.26312  ORF Transcript_13083/g.26312 Transcript_13083/m.26312 type:complete len:112 (+) Transcript_13083:224-559(+)